MLGPQKPKEYWQSIKEAIGNAAWDKYKLHNYLNVAPSINYVRNFDANRPIIPPIPNYMLKPSATYLTS
jgi:hypothetical protein